MKVRSFAPETSFPKSQRRTIYGASWLNRKHTLYKTTLMYFQEIIKLLLKHGANMGVKNLEEKPPVNKILPATLQVHNMYSPQQNTVLISCSISGAQLIPSVRYSAQGKEELLDVYIVQVLGLILLFNKTIVAGPALFYLHLQKSEKGSFLELLSKLRLDITELKKKISLICLSIC